ncbi:hypothetical protein GCM10022235_86390 [Kribbella ginsengisoli]|uniref:Uncharacterized protein n=2 Tax=Kribbella ginsengisoli TaxID=363865 RepID=A0ABP6Z9V0_9ACTN
MVPSAQGAGSVRASISLSAPASGAYGSVIKLTGTAARAGTSTRLSGATIYLQRSLHGRNRYANLASARTSRAGAFAFSVKQGSPYDYRVYYAGSARYSRAYSGVRYPVVNRVVLFDAIATTNSETGTLAANGRVLPAPPNGTLVYLQRYSTDAKVWVNVASGATTAGKVTVTATRPGSTDTYRLIVGGAAPYGAGISASRALKHYVDRGAFAVPLKTVTTTVQGTVTRTSAYEANVSLGAINGAVHIHPDIASCVHAYVATRVTNTTKPMTLFLVSETKSDAITIPALSNGYSHMDLDLTGASSLRYSVFSEAAVNFSVSVKLRCAN